MTSPARFTSCLEALQIIAHQIVSLARAIARAKDWSDYLVAPLAKSLRVRTAILIYPLFDIV